MGHVSLEDLYYYEIRVKNQTILRFTDTLRRLGCNDVEERQISTYTGWMSIYYMLLSEEEACMIRLAFEPDEVQIT